jgi:hypothetical protein
LPVVIFSIPFIICDVSADVQRAQFFFCDLSYDLTGDGKDLYSDILWYFTSGYGKYKGRLMWLNGFG